MSKLRHAPIPASITDAMILNRVSKLEDDEWQELHDMAELEGSLSEKEMVAQIRKTNRVEMYGNRVTALYVDPEGNACVLFE